MGLLKKLKAFLNEEEKKYDEPEINKLFDKDKAGFETEIKNGSVADICEQLVDVTYHAEDLRREYKLVTGYLSDIQRIEELPVAMANEVVETAKRIEMLDNTRRNYLQSENLLTLEQFDKIASLEKDIPESLKKLYDMEARDSMLKSDMGYLEGEKEDILFMREENANSINRTRNMLMAVLISGMLIVFIIASVSLMTKTSATVYSLVIGVVALASFVGAYLKYLNLKSEIRLADAKYARAVSLLNKVKVKYINNTNTLDYIYSKFDVHSARELEFMWQQYNTMVRDSLKYSQATSDYRVYCEDLVELLTKAGLSDPSIWIKQTRAIVDRRDMVEIKHGLYLRRQKLREQLDGCLKMSDLARITLNDLCEESIETKKIVKEILSGYNISL